MKSSFFPSIEILILSSAVAHSQTFGNTDEHYMSNINVIQGVGEVAITSKEPFDETTEGMKSSGYTAIVQTVWKDKSKSEVKYDVICKSFIESANGKWDTPQPPSVSNWETGDVFSLPITKEGSIEQKGLPKAFSSPTLDVMPYDLWFTLCENDPDRY